MRGDIAARSHAAMVRKGPLRFEIAGAAPLPEDRRHPPRDLQTHGNKHVAFQVPDLETFLAGMAEKRADIASSCARPSARVASSAIVPVT